jgi:AGCS family alanine or glycine:cation symporter
MYSIQSLLSNVGNFLWGWPILGLFTFTGILATLLFRFMQFTYFWQSCKLVIFPPKSTKKAEMSPLQAFINSLGGCTGNGSIAGVATAIALGGPGAAFWMLVAGFLGMIIRFVEVFLGTSVIGKHTFNGAKGGPLVYLSLVPGGKFIPYIYAFFMLVYCLVSGNAMQVNAIGLGVEKAFGVSTIITAVVIGLFVAFVMLGGLKRILELSDKLVPFKVAFFMFFSLGVLIFHANSLIPSLILIFRSAMHSNALLGGVAGFTLQKSLKNGFSRAINANESGLGSAAVLFGASGGGEPLKDSLMSMVVTFLSTHVVGFMIALSVIASGVWNSGEMSTALTIKAFETVYGSFGGAIVTMSSILFGLGVVVSYVLVGLEMWKFITHGKFIKLFYIIYTLISFFGVLVSVGLVWDSIDIIMAAMLIFNLYALIYFMLPVRKEVFNILDNTYKK